MDQEFRDRLKANYRELLDDQVVIEASSYLNSNDCRLVPRTLDLKQLTKVVSHAIDCIDPETALCAADYCIEGARRIETGIAKHDPGYTEWSYKVMLSHFYSHCSKFLYIAANVGDAEVIDIRIQEALSMAQKSVNTAVKPVERKHKQFNCGILMLALARHRNDVTCLREAYTLLERCVKNFEGEDFISTVLGYSAEAAHLLSQHGYRSNDMARLALAWYERAYNLRKERGDSHLYEYAIACGKHLQAMAMPAGKDRLDLLRQAYNLAVSKLESSCGAAFCKAAPMMEIIIRDYAQAADMAEGYEALLKLATFKLEQPQHNLDSGPDTTQRNAFFACSHAADLFADASGRTDDRSEKIYCLEQAIKCAEKTTSLPKNHDERHWAITWTNAGHYAEDLFKIDGRESRIKYALQAWGTGLNTLRGLGNHADETTIRHIERKIAIYSARTGSKQSKRVPAIRAKGKDLRREHPSTQVETKKRKYTRKRINLDDTSMWYEYPK